ncbi:MAG TPA: hypothetical protein VHU18_01485 [Rhizomicrobium sp.]|jgi:hypothetical protein|nr:hypothetical protein [Rhizomicrobium sp.]
MFSRFGGSVCVGVEMTERAEARSPAEAAAEAVKTYIRLNRERLASDGELLALLLPDRFAAQRIGDLQLHVIEKLRDENMALRAERDGLKGAREHALQLGEAVKARILDLIDARTFEEAIGVAVRAAKSFGADRAALCVEGEGAAPKNCDGVRLIARGTSAALLGQGETSALLLGGGAMLLGPAARDCRSIAAFRLDLGRKAPALLYVLCAREAGRFEGEEEEDLCYFARALERTMRAWLDLPRA